MTQITPDLTAEEIIRRLELKPHPAEGGYYREIYRAEETIAANALPARYGGARSIGTAIYYLLTPDTVSALHVLDSDEAFHFYLGDPVEMLQLHPDGRGERLVIGTDLAAGQAPLVIVRRGVWQGSRLIPGGRFALLGTTVAPGFEFADYRHGDGVVLAKAYPAQAALIRILSR